MHHNGCVNGYVIKRLSDVLTLYLSNEMVNDVLTLSKVSHWSKFQAVKQSDIAVSYIVTGALLYH